MGVFFLWFVAVVTASAEALERPWYFGQVLSQVTLEAPEGGLPDENLQPLLKARQGRAFDPADVRSDLNLLYSLGLFEAVEAHVEPWVEFDEEGRETVVALLTYRVYPASSLRRIVVRGNRAFSDAQLLAEIGLQGGQRFIAEEDLEPLRWRLLAAYAEIGFAQVSLRLDLDDRGEGRLDLLIEIDEGTPLVLGEVRYQGSPALSERRMRWIGLRQGLRTGAKYTLADIERSREKLEEVLHRRGWVEARVTPVLSPPFRSDGGDLLSILVQTGPHTTVEIRGEGLPSARRLKAALEPRLGSRLGRTELEIARQELEEMVRGWGYREARLELVLEEAPGKRTVVVTGESGPMHRLARDGVIFNGNTRLDDRYLLGAIRESSDVLARGHVTDREVQEGTEAIEDIYRSQGHLDVRVVADVEERSRERRLVRLGLLFDVDEGVRTLLDTVSLQGVDPELMDVLSLLARGIESKPLDPSAVQDLVRRVTEAHRELGYLSADTTTDLVVSRDGHVATLNMRVEIGERSFLRNVVIRGNRRTRRPVIQDQVAVAVGEPITPSALAETRRRLYALDLFSVVDLRLEGDEAGVRDLIVEVKEKSVMSLELGGGLATDTGVRVFTRALRRNLFGLGHRFSALGEVGLGYQGDDWRLDATSPEWRAAARYEAPRLLPGESLLFMDLLANERLQEPTFRLERTGVGTGLQVGNENRWRVVLSYRVQQRWIQDVAAGALVGGDPWFDGAAQVDLEQLEMPMGPRIHAGPDAVALLDLRDDRFNPTRGVLSSLQVDGTSRFLGGQRSVRVVGLGRAIVPMGRLGLHLGAGGGIGWAEGRSTTLALEERFRLGGANTLRGYALDSVGPKNRVALDVIDWPEGLEPLVEEATRDTSDRWVPTGGDAMVHSSLEVWTPLSVLGLSRTNTTSLVAFLDVGNVFFVDPTVLTTSAVVDPEPLLRYGCGAGLRMATPVGPVQLDLAINPQYFAASWPEGRGEEPWRLHFSLGAL
ncbi:MAG: POTRA domain-containing protein [Myxococcota bacterium]|nr:POTRA domain-containing protein [Myxococcota bacterium]